MLTKVKWISHQRPKLSPWKYEPYTPERQEELKKTADVQNGSVVFRKSLSLAQTPFKAELHISGLGFYEVWINGKKPDERRVFAPVLSDYYRLTRYDSYDVTQLLSAGENALCAELGAGWFAPVPKWWGWQQFWYGDPRMAARLVVTYADGSSEEFTTDESWLCRDGAITFSDMYDGEYEDFRLLSSRWRERSFDCGDWSHAVISEPPTDNIRASFAPPIRIARRLKPVSVLRLSDTQAIYDFGENGAAIPRVLVRGHEGDVVELDHAEYVFEDGTLNPKSENGALSHDVYTLTEGEEHLCGPRFIWHGYRYMMLTLSSPDIEVLSVESCIIHSDLTPTGSFSCSHEGIMRLHEAYVRTLLACLIGVPIDCPQRNERKAWLGDMYVVSDMAMYNFDMRALYTSLLEDMRIGRNSQNLISYIAPVHMQFDDRTCIDYNVSYPVLLSGIDRRYRDTDLIAYHYPVLKEHMAFYERQCENGFVEPSWFGDWFSIDMPEGMKKVDFRPGPEGHRQNPPFLGTVYYCMSLRLSAELADRIGEHEDAEHYRRLWKISRDALNARCLDRESGKFGSGGQFLSAIALYENIVEEDCREAVFGELVRSLEEKDWHPWCGITGNRMLYEVLQSFGRADLAWKVLTVEGFPGPLNMLSDGRTTLTEALDGRGSGCHNMFASPDAMLYKMIAGITVDRGARYAVRIAPYFAPDLTFARATQRLYEGEVCVDWRREGDCVKCEITVPAGIVAEVCLPGREPFELSGETKIFTI